MYAGWAYYIMIRGVSLQRIVLGSRLFVEVNDLYDTYRYIERHVLLPIYKRVTVTCRL